MNRLSLSLTIVSFGIAAASAAGEPPYDARQALETSQRAIGRQLTDVDLLDSHGQAFRFSDLAGRPVIVSMIFTSCHHICPTLTKNLAIAVHAAREVLGDDSFAVVTIGFDARNDDPEAMRNFAREQRVDVDGWYFLSGNEQAIDAVSAATGFQFFPSPRGFDHINQLTVVDRQGAVYRQVYGVDFELPALVEPLKELVFNRPESQGHVLAGVVDRVRLFCTVYNPATGRYEIDNSLFIQMAIGMLIILSVVVYLWRGMRDSRRRPAK